MRRILSRVVLIIFAVSLLFSFGCTSANSSDKVSITGFEPKKDLVQGIETEFKVLVDYKLSSAEKATVQICFNDGNDEQAFYPKGEKEIAKGEGKCEFTVKATPKKLTGDNAFAGEVYIVSVDKKILSSARLELEVAEHKNELSIKSIEPDKEVIEGAETDFKVVAEYNLVSHEEAELTVGFNDGEDGNSFYTKGKQTVKKGSKEVVFNVKATPKNLGNGFDFSANLSLVVGDKIISTAQKTINVSKNKNGISIVSIKPEQGVKNNVKTKFSVAAECN